MTKSKSHLMPAFSPEVEHIICSCMGERLHPKLLRSRYTDLEVSDKFETVRQTWLNMLTTFIAHGLAHGAVGPRARTRTHPPSGSVSGDANDCWGWWATVGFG